MYLKTPQTGCFYTTPLLRAGNVLMYQLWVLAILSTHLFRPIRLHDFWSSLVSCKTCLAG